MKTLQRSYFLALFLLFGMFALVSCSKDTDPIATINVHTTTSNKSGDVSGNGGSTTKTFKFNNTSTTAGWDMDSNASTGSFQMILKDAAGVTVVNKTLTSTQSADGTSMAGIAGEWTATIILTNYNGSGDYSFR